VAPPVGDANVIVAASGDGQLTGLSAVDGKRKWAFGREVPALSLRGGATPLVKAGLVVHGFQNGRLVAAALANGLEAWDTPLALARGRTELDRMVDVGGAPLERGGTVFAATFQGRIAAVGLQSGEQIWSRELSCFQPLAADDYNVYATDADGKLWAFDQRTGLTYWEQDAFKGRRPTAPAVLGRFIAFGDALGELHLLSADSGKPVARIKLGDDPFAFQPAVRNGVALLYSTGGRLYAVRPAP
jgi:outer membrane protein assembly factor BamB